LTAFTPYLSTQIAFGVLIGVVLLLVSRMTLRRQAHSQFPTAGRMFAVWWGSLGVAWWVWAGDTLLVGSGASGSVAGLIDYMLVAAYFVFIFVAFASLFYYLLFLFVGSPRLSWAVWLLYGAIAVVLAGLLALADPAWDGHVTGLNGDAIFGAYTNVADVLGVVFIVPVIIAALSLFFVVRRAEDHAQRYRILLLSTSLAFYLLMPLFFDSNPGIQPDGTAAWVREILNKVGLLAAVAAVVLAYRPPAWVAKRIGARTQKGP
jgi:uncharacterized membrane protein